MRELLCGFACMSFANDPITETHCEFFLRTNRTTSEDQI